MRTKKVEEKVIPLLWVLFFLDSSFVLSLSESYFFFHDYSFICILKLQIGVGFN